MSNTLPKLSIITINYNNTKGLEKTLSSVWNDQTYSNFEHIVIDGGSTDGSVDVIKKYADKLTYWVSEPDKGIYNAMNKGILKAKGEYLLFLNSGDWLCSDSIKDIFKTEFNQDIISGNYIIIKENGKTSVMESPQEISMPQLMLHSLGHPATLIKRELLIENPYHEEYKIISDWAFWIEELIIKNRTYRKISVNISNYDFTGISSLEKNKKIINKETKEFLIKTFGPRFEADKILDYVLALDNISKHKIDKLILSKKIQRRLRLCYKLFRLFN